MSIKRNDKVFPWLYHGGPIKLGSLMKQVIEITITFPHTGSQGQWVCTPVTLNLSTDIGITSNARVYAVDWEGSDDTTTVTNTMSSFKHEHTFKLEGTQSSYVKKYQITLYGDPLLPHQGYRYSLGDGNLGYSVVSNQISLRSFNNRPRVFESDNYWDKTIPSGARITRAFFGDKIVYGKVFAGATLKVDIELYGNGNIVRLVNPLVRDCNDWDSKKTDVKVDWGDGNISYIVNRFVNSGLYNTDSPDIIEHKYKGSIGQRFTISITSVEPLLPIGCTVTALYGSFPEDCYVGNDYLLTYGRKEKESHPFREQLEDHNRNITRVGADLCDNWVRTYRMRNTFRYWGIREIPEGFFKSNILDICTEYIGTFSFVSNLSKVDPLLLGRENNVITDISEMFLRTSLENTLDLERSSSVVSISGIFHRSRISSADKFLLSAPKLQYANDAFMETKINSHNPDMFSDSEHLESISSIFCYTKMTEIILDFKKYAWLQDISNAYSNCPLKIIKRDTFGGNFAINVPDRSLNMNGVFSAIGDSRSKRYTVIEVGAFQPLGKISDKISDTVTGFLNSSFIDRLHEDMFKSVFKSQTPRFTIEDMFNSLITSDEFSSEFDEDKVRNQSVHIPKVFTDCGGIISLKNSFSGMGISWIDVDLLKDIPDLASVESMLSYSKINTRVLDQLFTHSKKISNWSYLLSGAYITYGDIPIDRIIHSDVESVDISGMFDTRNDVKVYRLFSHDSKVKSVHENYSGWIRNSQSLPKSVIFGNRPSNITTDDYNQSTDMIFDICVDQSMPTVTIVEEVSDSPSPESKKCRVEIDGHWEYVNLPWSYRFYEYGHHRIVVNHNKSVKLTGDGFDVVRLSGEYPYNSKPDLTNLSHYKLREIDRNVFAVCDHNHIHSNPYFNEYIPIMHKDIFKYHDDVTSSKFFNMDKYKLKGMYGIQPGILDGMVNIRALDNIYSSEMKVLTPHHIPNNLKLDNRNPEIISHYSTSPIVVTGDIVNNSIDDYVIHCAQVVSNKSLNIQKGRPFNDYLEFYLEGVRSNLRIIKLSDEPTFPIEVEILSKSISGAHKYIINGFSDTINVSGDVYVRVYSDKPVWIDQKDNIKELFGSIPPCEWNYKMKDMCPRLRRIGDKLLIHLTNTSIRGMFSGLPDFEYFPGTLFWYNYNLVDYEESFSDCPKLFKVDDYIITAKSGLSINCRNMFRNSGIVSVRNPIMDDINAKVDITGMFSGCKTWYFYGFGDGIDHAIFKNIDIYGSSGIVHEGAGIHNDNDHLHMEIDSGNVTGLQHSYYINSRVVSSVSTSGSLKFASQSIGGQVLMIDRRFLTSDMTKYIPFVYKTETVENGDMVPGLYDYMEYITNISPASSHSDNSFIRNNYLVDISGLYKDFTFSNVNIQMLLPYVMRGIKYCSSLFENTKGVVIPSNYKFGSHIITDMSHGFTNTNFEIPKGIFDNVSLIAIPDNSVRITELCKGNRTQTVELGVFKAYGSKLNSTGTVGVYSNCDNMVNIDIDMYSGCDLEVVDYHFSRCLKLATLPKINHMNKIISYQHMFEMTAIESVPENYIYTTRNDKDIMIDYMFADCPALFLENKFIDSRCPGMFSIDYSLNNVLTSVGDDADIFGDINYDSEFDHRSRVIPFDERIGWIQHIRTRQNNQTVKVTSLQIPDLVGKTLNKVASIIWGDNSRPVVIRPGEVITANHITHTYVKAGNYVFKVMMQDVTAYIETRGSYVETTELPTGFKFGNITEVRDKTLVAMFGSNVESVSVDLFNRLQGVNYITYYDNMFRGFRMLRDLPVGILDCMPNLVRIDGLLSDSKSNTNIPVKITLKSGLIDKLTKLTSFRRIGFNSNVSSIEDGFFKQQHSGILNIISMLENSRCKSIPVTLLNPLVNLVDGSYMLRDTREFVLNSSYDDMFITNTKITTLNYAFSGVKITGLGTEMLNNIGASLKSIDGTFGVALNINSAEDDSTWIIPSGFMDELTSLSGAFGAFRGRKSLTYYPVNLLNSTKDTLNNTRDMFRDTGITTIHQGTITDKTIRVDARHMFSGCNVKNCPKVVTSSTGVIETFGMLKGVSGELSERELFEGIRTDPSDIQSMYRQEFKFFYMDVTLDKDEDLYVHALENTLPWRDFIVEVKYGNKTISIKDNINAQDELKRLTQYHLPAGNHTIGIKAPFATEIRTVSGTVIKVNRLYGVFGKMKTDRHIAFKDTIYGKMSNCTIDDDDFYMYNKHLVNLYRAFAETKIQYVKTDAFRHLVNATEMDEVFESNTVYAIKDGYKPNFDHMKIDRVSRMYSGCTSFKPNKDYEPFVNINTIAVASRTFYNSGIITTPRVNPTKLGNVQEMYAMCSNLTTTYANIFDNFNRCSYYYGVFRDTPKLKIIEGESDTKTIMTDIIPAYTTAGVDISRAFKNTGLSYQQVIRIVNNLSMFRKIGISKVDCTEMFMDTVVSGTEKGNLKLNIRTVDRNIIANRMFYNCGISDIPKNAIDINNGTLAYSEMFYNCFTDKTVQHLDEVFLVPDHAPDTDYRSSELDTLNVFDLDITSTQESVINLKYVGAVHLDNVRYAEVTVGSSSNTYYTETIDQLQSIDITIPAGTTKVSICSVPLLMPVKKSGDFVVNGVNSHLSTHRDNYVDWNSRFSFGQYFGDAKVFNIRLGGQFYVKDGEFYTLNGIFKGMKYITSYPRNLFIDYKGGTVDGVNKIVGIIETFADNTALNDIDVGMLQYISGIESIRRAWYNTALTEIKPGTFASCNTIRDVYEAFGNTKVNKLPTRLLVINN